MIWLFLAVVLVLVVLHPGFRRVVGWITAVGIVLAAIGLYKFTHPTPDPCPWKPSVLAGTDECGSGNPAAANPLDSLPPPTTGQPVVPCADLPENLRAGSNCTKARWKEVTDPCLLAQLNGPTDSADAKACAEKQKTPPANPPAGYTLDCPTGQTPAKDSRTGMQSCYDPHDPAQLAEHLKECKIKPGDPYAGVGAVVADRSGVPCNVFDQFDGTAKRKPK